MRLVPGEKTSALMNFKKELTIYIGPEKGGWVAECDPPTFPFPEDEPGMYASAPTAREAIARLFDRYAKWLRATAD